MPAIGSVAEKDERQARDHQDLERQREIRAEKFAGSGQLLGQFRDRDSRHPSLDKVRVIDNVSGDENREHPDRGGDQSVSLGALKMFCGIAAAASRIAIANMP